MNRTRSLPYTELESDYDWIFFTSVNAVKYFDFTQLNKQAKILAIGNQTNKVLRERGLTVNFQPREGFSEGLVHEWLTTVSEKQRIFWPHSLLARRVIHDRLTKQGHQVLEQTIYTNEFLPEDRFRLNELLENERLDYVLFASPSAWESFYQSVLEQENVAQDFWLSMKIAAIGPVTAKVIERAGKEVWLQPSVYDMHHLYQELLIELTQSQTEREEE